MCGQTLQFSDAARKPCFASTYAAACVLGYQTVMPSSPRIPLKSTLQSFAVLHNRRKRLHPVEWGRNGGFRIRSVTIFATRWFGVNPARSL